MINYENLKILLQNNNIEVNNFFQMNQIHSGNVSVIHADSLLLQKNKDALITKQKGVFLSVKTADCMPIVLFDPKNIELGVIHAGYRGILNRVIENSLEKFIELGSNPQNILVIIGPSIRSCCYTVDRKRAGLFKKRFGRSTINEADGHHFLDLIMTAKNILKQFQISDKNILVSEYCTSCRDDLYFSFRKNKSSERFITIASIQ